MIAVRVMQPPVHEVIDVIAVWHRFVTAVRAMLVRAARLRRALHGVGGADGEDVLVDVILVHVVEMAVVKIVDVALMADRGMTTPRPVLMGVVGMVLLAAGGHGYAFPSWSCHFSTVIAPTTAVMKVAGPLHLLRRALHLRTH
jgi:hypothetical protein